MAASAKATQQERPATLAGDWRDSEGHGGWYESPQRWRCTIAEAVFCAIPHSQRRCGASTKLGMQGFTSHIRMIGGVCTRPSG